jgi:transcriptional regulator of acetoin/glycerol metabolism
LTTSLPKEKRRTDLFPVVPRRSSRTRTAGVPSLYRTHGNIKEAASILGVDRSTLYDRLKKYHLPRNQ